MPGRECRVRNGPPDPVPVGLPDVGGGAVDHVVVHGEDVAGRWGVARHVERPQRQTPLALRRERDEAVGHREEVGHGPVT